MTTTPRKRPAAKAATRSTGTAALVPADDNVIDAEAVEETEPGSAIVAASNLPDLIQIHEKTGMAVFSNAGAKFVREMFGLHEATDIELAYFAQLSNDLQLDPRRGELHLVSRWDNTLKRMKATPQVSLAGMLSLAERSGEYRGHTQYQWCGPDGQWVDVWLAAENPAAARVGVRRAGYDEPVYGIARWSSYCATKKDGSPTQMWTKFPDRMLAKCALMQALREAFPRSLNGTYGVDEMQQADTDATAVEVAS